MSAAFGPLRVCHLTCVFSLYGLNYNPNKTSLCLLEAVLCRISKASAPKAGLFLPSLRPICCWNDPTAFISLLKLFTPLPPSGRKLNCAAVETAFLLSHVSGCQNSIKIRLRVICADLLEVVQGGVTADKVRRRSALRVLCPVEPSPIILFKMWESGRQTERTLLWHPRFFFYFLAFHLTLRLNIWKSVAMATLSGWWGGSIRHVWQPACVEADGQPDSCPCWILLSPPGEAEQGWTN